MPPLTLSQAHSLGSNGATHSAPIDHAKAIIEELWAADPEAIVDAIIDRAFDSLTSTDPGKEAKLVQHAGDFRRALQALRNADFAATPTPAPICASAIIENHFRQFKSRYKPARFGDEAAVREAFFRLPFADATTLNEDGLTFAEDFWEGFERNELSDGWKKEGGKYIPGALKFLDSERWRERDQKTLDGRAALGETQRRRLAEERHARPRALSTLTRGLGIFEPEPPPDKRSVEQVYADNIAAGQPRNPAMEAWLRSNGLPIPTPTPANKPA